MKEVEKIVEVEKKVVEKEIVYVEKPMSTSVEDNSSNEGYFKKRNSDYYHKSPKCYHQHNSQNYIEKNSGDNGRWKMK